MVEHISLEQMKVEQNMLGRTLLEEMTPLKVLPDQMPVQQTAQEHKIAPVSLKQIIKIFKMNANNTNVMD